MGAYHLQSIIIFESKLSQPGMPTYVNTHVYNILVSAVASPILPVLSY